MFEDLLRGAGKLELHGLAGRVCSDPALQAYYFDVPVECPVGPVAGELGPVFDKITNRSNFRPTAVSLRACSFKGFGVFGS